VAAHDADTEQFVERQEFGGFLQFGDGQRDQIATLQALCLGYLNVTCEMGHENYEVTLR
jgi:hypothetical protein